MICFIDTSAIYAILDARDSNNAKAGKIWTTLITKEYSLVCTNYVLLESTALMQSRLGLGSVKVFHTDVLPLLKVEWLTEKEHQSGVASLLVANRRALSLVDCISFNTMRKLGVDTVFAFDPHFKEQGFEILR